MLCDAANLDKLEGVPYLTVAVIGRTTLVVVLMTSEDGGATRLTYMTGWNSNGAMQIHRS